MALGHRIDALVGLKEPLWTRRTAIVVRIMQGLVRQMVAAGLSQERKVRASQGRVVDNIDRSQDQGKCHRKDTAERSVRADAW